MKFGIVLNSVPGLGLEASFDSILKLTEASEEMGFHSVWMPDHLINPTGASQIGGPFEGEGIFEAWTTLSALSTVTRKVKLGSLVSSNPFRIPTILAKMVATLDVISGGRVILGIGAGWLKREYLAYSIPWEKHQVRFEKLSEGVKVIKMLWTQEKTNFVGKHYKLKDAILEPKPIQKPHPPIWIGCSGSERTLKLAVEEGDGIDFDIHRPIDQITETIKTLRRYCKSIGRDVETLNFSTHAIAIITPRNEEAVETAKAYAKAIGKPYDIFLKTFFIGSPEVVISKIERYMEAGFTHLFLQFEPNLDSLKTFAKKVKPHFDEQSRK